ncbi:Huntingtin interacting protein 1 (Hip1) interactor Hippi [Plasmopara halstedii]|uniref:Huntingtin interacting protein 1 (Hip1) interactor Hippi n=1 Tax=Plasmopara halstedii TaxID=4781 RepID=A0A0P1AHM6_PLAHL|nr:Huntingtin interacting protein 1 (Hip1) interactor Hippi [Plasmopara halstedii]CEG39972.1 Huntingtin interacting protein 1 (Hip1) interactor Hippi [Plasmopara halstedii]|eukprot:XP_024576341.1 Huntingtin interacting protein 1 (Hip1) interactor Hippi [Plasmopara halstedii]
MADEVGGDKTIEQATRDDVSVTIMGNVLEKLRVLQYERDLVKKKSLTPYNEVQFAFMNAGVNASAQFKSFLDLVTFLLKSCGQDLVVDKYDDPNTSVNKLILTLKTLGFSLDFPASKLKLGYGEAVCAALDFICDQALAAQHFDWPRPQYPKEDFADEAEVDDDAEVDTANDDDETLLPGREEETEELFSDLVGSGKVAEDRHGLDHSFQQMIISDVNPLLWKMELERVGPRLKVKGGAAASGKEWHTHIERSRDHETIMNELLPRATTQLRLLGAQLTDAVGRMGAKEKMLNSQYDHLKQEFAFLKEKLQAATEISKAAADRVNVMAAEYAETTELLKETKGVMDERGAKMTDTSPLVYIKGALKTLAAEIKNFDLRIGIVSHTLLQAKSRQITRRRGGAGASADDQSYQDPEYDLSDEDSS